MGDVADDMMDEAQRWHDEKQKCKRGHWYVEDGWGCYSCEVEDEENCEREMEHERALFEALDLESDV